MTASAFLQDNEAGLADKDYVGFYKAEDDGDYYSTRYNEAGDDYAAVELKALAALLVTGNVTSA